MSTASRDGRVRILHAARTLFLERGYADTSMQQIADAAGVTKATLYHHFRDKEDLFIEVVAQEHESLGEALLGAVAGASTLEEQLERIAVGVFHMGESDMGRLAMDLRQHVSPERALALQHTMHAPDANAPENVLRDLFRRAAARGEIIPIDPDLPFAAFFSMVVGLSRFSDLPAGPRAFTEEDVRLIPKILLHGISAVSTLRDLPFPRDTASSAGDSARPAPADTPER